jgi:hypothetical protein
MVNAAADASPSANALGDMPSRGAFEACEGKTKGDACSVKLAELELQGCCEAAPPDSKDPRLVCRPSGPPPEAPRE